MSQIKNKVFLRSNFTTKNEENELSIKSDQESAEEEVQEKLKAPL